MTLIILYALLVIQGAFLICIGLKILAMKNTEDTPKPPPKPIFKHSKPIVETEEQRRQRILDENIENYDGTPKGQIKL